jgi:hypothetical protein
MNTDQVVEMIDAITEGRRYLFNVDEATTIVFSPEHFEVVDEHGDELVASIDNERLAREIAGALVAWANRKQGTEERLTINAFLSAIGVPQDAVKINSSRQDWYARNIQFMDVPTLRRNFDDLMRITKTKGLPDADKADANRAKDFIWSALREKDPETKQCQRCLLLDGPLHSKFCEGKRSDV